MGQADKKATVDEEKRKSYIKPSSQRDLVFRWPRTPVGPGFLFMET